MILFTASPLAGLGSAEALPPEDWEPPRSEFPPLSFPRDGRFHWRVDSRFGSGPHPSARFHWDEATATYDPAYVRPSSLVAHFDGCVDDREAEAADFNDTKYDYTWELRSPDGGLIESVRQPNCFWDKEFALDPVTGEGLPHKVVLRITERIEGSPPWPGYPTGITSYEEPVQVKDLLIVSIGDSYASGEGNPDIPQKLKEGLPTPVFPALWVDRRCHRSAHAAPAQAATALDRADPHSSVTFLSFACSGATISRHYYDDGSPFDPYRNVLGSQKPRGTGILGPYVGVESADGGEIDYNDKLPSQIDQLRRAITNDGAAAPRRIHALTISGGGNDMGFGPIAQVCTMYYECPEHEVLSFYISGYVPLRERFEQDRRAAAARYVALRNALAEFSVDHTYITQYPDPTKDDDGSLCSTMLDDVIPWWMQPLLALAAIPDGAAIPGLPFQMDRADGSEAKDEVAFAAGPVLSGINGAVAAAAQAHGWTLVDGIADSSANLFSGHGYCADHSWVRNAADAVRLQGPGVPDMPWGMVPIPPFTTKTSGTMHPTTEGLEAVANRMVAKMQPDLVPPPPPGPPRFNDVKTGAVRGAAGWLIGDRNVASHPCPPGVKDCVPVEIRVTADTGAELGGVALTRAGTPVSCSSTGVTENGLHCRTSRESAMEYRWKLAFVEDGIYPLQLLAITQNGSVTTFRPEYKIDLHDPVSASATAASAHEQRGGWYRDPVMVTFSGVDRSGGSGIAGIEYQLNGGTSTLVGEGGRLELTSEGEHTVTYRPVDFAGRKGAVEPPLIVRIDRTPPVISCAHPDNEWHGQDVAIACTAADAASGLADAANASFSLQTSVPAGQEVTEASTDAREVCDMAGNCPTVGPIGPNKVDRRPPSIVIASPIAGASFYLDQSVVASYQCTDVGSGLADGSCLGPVPHGAPVDTSSVGAKELTVTAADKAGNTAAAQAPYIVTKRQASISYTGASSADYHDPAVVSARLMDTSPPAPEPVVGATLSFALGAERCSGTTDASGHAACTLTPNQPAGESSVTVTFDGTSRHAAASVSAPFVVTKEQTITAVVGKTVFANGREATVVASLLEEGTVPVAGRQVVLVLGTGQTAQQCVAASAADGTAACRISPVRQPLGPGSLSVAFAGDAFYEPASAHASTMLFQFVEKGTFVVGSEAASVGSDATFWGAKWPRANALAGRAAHGFKGFALEVDPTPAHCGGTWNAQAADASAAPSQVPTYLAVAVSPSVSPSGSTLSARVTQIVVVKVDGYGPAPATPGTGTVVAVVC